MRSHRMLALGAASLVLLASACTSGGGGSPTVEPSAAASQPASQAASQPAELPTVTVGSAGFDEAALLAEIYAQALEAKGFTVERQLQLGERPIVQAAFDAGEINLAPEFLGGLGTFLEAEGSPDPQQALDNMQDALADKGLAAFDFAPANDADGWVVRSETAEEFGLATMSDVAEVADQLVWGLAPGCPENPVCGPGLNEVYGIDISQIEVESLEPCSVEMAEALNASAIDVAQVCTTQPAIEQFNFVLLEDDKALQPAQNVVPIATQELADAGGDTMADALNAVSALLTTEELTTLNVLVQVEQQSFEDVARQWLEDNALI
jgi:osmoprotectant transport system substrate-binding protein